jgi:WhiB family redox-sensing transcriptional regulator
MKVACERGEENVQARIGPGGGCLWTSGALINKQVTRLSPVFPQPARRTIARMPSRLEPTLTENTVTENDLASGWQQFAECVQHAGEVDFFPARGESLRDAKAVCTVCPVKTECLEFALRLKVAHGVWGGLSERERRSLRRERHRGEPRPGLRASQRTPPPSQHA